MEAVAEEHGLLEKNEEIGFEDDTVNVIQDEEYDFEIGFSEEGVEASGVLEHTDGGLTYQAEGSDILYNSRTSTTQGQVAHEIVDELYEDEIHDQDRDQHDQETSAFDASADTEEVSQTETGNFHKADKEQSVESQQYQEELYDEESAEELGIFVDPAQQGQEPVQSMMVITERVEYSHRKEAHENQAYDEVASDGQTALTHEGEENEPPLDTNDADGTIENEVTTVEDLNEETAENTSPEICPYFGDDVASQTNAETADTADGLEDTANHNAEEPFERSEEHPHVRVSYGTAEFYLFSESRDADPDDFFFENTDILYQPLSQFLLSLRQVISDDLEASDELFVKVDGLGLEFGETTTQDFLEQTTFGHLLELYGRLVKLDDGPEPPELYIYLETRPNCLCRLTELTNGANEGKGLSQVAYYYEGTPDLANAEDDSNNLDEIRHSMDSDDVSLTNSDDGTDGNLTTSHKTDQTYNPFRLSESQRKIIDASPPSGLMKQILANGSLSTDALEDPAYDGDENFQESFSGEVHNDVELERTDTLRDSSADGTTQDTAMVSRDIGGLAEEADNEEYEGHLYDEQGLLHNEELAGTETIFRAQKEHTQEGNVTTDDYDAADNDDYLDLEATEEPAQPANSVSTPESTSHHSKATVNLDGEAHGHGDDAPGTQTLADSIHQAQVPSQPELDSPQTQTDEIHWNDDEDDEVDIADQNQTDLSPSSFSVKRGRQVDEDDVGLGDDITAKRRRT